MSYLETAYIPKSEYKISESNRLIEDQMVANEFYTAMFALAKNRSKHEAVKLPIKLLDLARFEAGLYIASIGILNIDLQVSQEKEAIFSNGYWTNASTVDLWDIKTSDKLPIKQAHIKLYSDEIDDELRNLCLSQDLVIAK